MAAIKKELALWAIKQAEQEGKLNRAYEEQRVILEDVNELDINKRIEAGKEAIRIAGDIKQLKLEELDLLIEEAALKNKQNDTDDEAKLEYAKLVSQREQEEADFLKGTTEVRNKVNAMNAAQEAERVKAAADAAAAKKKEAGYCRSAEKKRRRIMLIFKKKLIRSFQKWKMK